jgi:hypothetical protein
LRLLSIVNFMSCVICELSFIMEYILYFDNEFCLIFYMVFLMLKVLNDIFIILRRAYVEARAFV